MSCSYRSLNNYTISSASKTPRSFQYLTPNKCKFVNVKENLGAFSISAAVRPSSGCARPRNESGWYKGITTG